jgi:hypothetical protein
MHDYLSFSAFSSGNGTLTLQFQTASQSKWDKTPCIIWLE